MATFRLDRRIEWIGEATYRADMQVSRDELCAMAAESLLGSLWLTDPDVVVIVAGWHITPDTYKLLRDRGVRVVLIHTESPYEDVRQCEMGWCADLHLVNDPLGVERMREVGIRHAYYSRHCYDPTVHHPVNGRRTGPVVFVGSGFKGRQELLAQVDWERVGGLTLAGQWDDERLEPWVADLPSPLDNDAAADLYRSHRVGLNIYRADHVQHPDLVDGWAMGPREVEMAACGLPFARQARPESDRVFPMLPTFTGADELADLCSWWLSHDEEREAASVAVQAAVAERTFDNNARGLLGLVEKVWPTRRHVA